MENNKKLDALHENEAFTTKISAATSYEEVKAAYATEGVDLDAVLDGVEASPSELSADDLDSVAGGISKSQVSEYLRALVKQLKMTKGGKSISGTLQWGANYFILLTASVDAAYGNVYKHYSYDQIKRAGDAMGFDIP